MEWKGVMRAGAPAESIWGERWGTGWSMSRAARRVATAEKRAAFISPLPSVCVCARARNARTEKHFC